MRVRWTICVALLMTHGAYAQVPACADLQWSEAVRSEYAGIEDACQGVYQRDGRLFARLTLEVVRVQGNRITFRPLHVDGSHGPVRSVRVTSEWRARLDGREYRASNLPQGQHLEVFIPEDRFAIAWGAPRPRAEASGGDTELVDIERLLSEPVNP